MNSYFDRWLKKEMEWISGEKESERKKAYLYSVLVAAAILLIAIVSRLTGGVSPQDFTKGLLPSLLIGILMGLVCLLFQLWNLGIGTKRYGKNVEKVIEQTLSQTERENFARQMLGEDSETTVREVDWSSAMEGHTVARVTKDYLTFADNKGFFWIAQLWKTERIELDVKDSSFRVRTGGASIRVADESYPMCLYYKGNQTETSDFSFVFSKREWRDNVLEAVRAVVGDSQFPEG